jgi:dTDP-4-dehydrorhamnose reductase
VDAPVHYISTDYVFDGLKDSPYVEWDQPNPQSVYGLSKLAGESELDDGSTVVRTSWVCGFHGPNMVKTILRLADEHETLSFVDDQFGHPTFADDLAAMITKLVTERRSGVFHVTNAGAVSWFEFAQEVLLAAGQDPARVHPIATADLLPARPAPRPANSVLDNAALRLSGMASTADFRVPLRRLVNRVAT